MKRFQLRIDGGCWFRVRAWSREEAVFSAAYDRCDYGTRVIEVVVKRHPVTRAPLQVMTYTMRVEKSAMVPV